MENKFIGEVTPETIQLLNEEFKKIPEKYRKPFNSNHEGYAVMLEEVRELEEEVFFGAKQNKAAARIRLENVANEKLISEYDVEKLGESLHKDAIRAEAVQVAAMAIRIIQELTY